MSSTTLPRPAAPGIHEPPLPAITLYGDFNCPWSYLAFRRAQTLAASGVEVEWRAVEHLPLLPHGRPSAPSAAFRDELELVLQRLLPAEELPHEPPRIVSRTAPAVAAYAEGCAADVAGPVARVLFESYWQHGIDVGDLYTLRTLLTDELRGSASPSRSVREWGAPVAMTGAPMSADAYRLVVDWSDQWRETGEQIVPVLQPSDGPLFRGIDAVDWLGDRITELGLTTDLPAAAASHCWRTELPDPGWASGDGGRWHRRFQRCGAAPAITAAPPG
ncbi:hypothetical protein GCM10011492_38610 [Flexivirga endophytica]|uniref:DSBA-like thioredoxin domain-containing protein n=1 Tax=Flexivirga endophytica TaxID=1849103 RepID=A0A916TJ10_9MICO|nr:DsbA family protein [Flexivirga endophytica]GGB43852.1 hypothetical protein GCM10011492_38610 [Flexivirga endophytica]GHB67982.1 hypothetical protein GCM10008112_40890 [Flexivirga endophytica]